MRIEARIEGDIRIIDPGGRLTVETAAEFTEAIHCLVAGGHTRLVLNMANVRAIDGCGLGAIARAFVAARCADGELTLLNLTSRTRVLLTITGLLAVIRTHDSEAAAALSVSGHASSQADGRPVQATTGGTALGARLVHRSTKDPSTPIESSC